MRAPLALAVLLALAAPARADLPPPPKQEARAADAGTPAPLEKAKEAGPPAPPPPPKPKPRPARADDGVIRLAVGEAHKLALTGGTQVVCDDPAVASVDVDGESLAIRGRGPGTTTCGARLAGAQRGTWTVTVTGR